MRILAIETSCDETAAAVLDGPRRLLSNVVFSQVSLHRPFGGIVPEIASRSHTERIVAIVKEALAQAELSIDQLDGIAATRGPGLLGALLVGMNVGQSMALASGLPFVGVNHLHGHLVSPDLDAPMVFPCLLWLVTGGHTALYYMTDETAATLLLRTVDDAVGEAFDKVARMLGLPYPGGPPVEQAARTGTPGRVQLPVPRPKDDSAVSLSGLKTAVLRHLESIDNPGDQDVADICYGFQDSVSRLLVRDTGRGLERCPDARAVYLVGGVARNRAIFGQLAETCQEHGVQLAAPSPQFCTDNAAMIARAGWTRLHTGDRDPLDLQPQSRWEFGTWLD